MAALNDLRRFCPPPAVVPPTARPGPPSEALTVPRDHCALVEVYGTGCFDDFLWIYGEGIANRYLDIAHQTRVARSVLAGRRLPGIHACLSEFGVRVADLVMWGGTENADSLLWMPSGRPDEWPTLIIEARQFSQQVVHGSSTEILLGLLTGRLRTDVFPDDFPSARPEFRTTFRSTFPSP